MEPIYWRKQAAAVQHTLPEMPPRLQTVLPRYCMRLPGIREQAEKGIEMVSLSAKTPLVGGVRKCGKSLYHPARQSGFAGKWYKKRP
jgi:hypothetical protein